MRWRGANDRDFLPASLRTALSRTGGIFTHRSEIGIAIEASSTARALEPFTGSRDGSCRVRSSANMRRVKRCVPLRSPFLRRIFLTRLDVWHTITRFISGRSAGNNYTCAYKSHNLPASTRRDLQASGASGFLRALVAESDGGVPERPKGADCKSAGSAFGGSNPPPSTSTVLRMTRKFIGVAVPVGVGRMRTSGSTKSPGAIWNRRRRARLSEFHQHRRV